MLFGSNNSSAPRSDFCSSAWARARRSPRNLSKSMRCSQSPPIVAPREAMLVIGVSLSPSCNPGAVCALGEIVNQIEHRRQRWLGRMNGGDHQLRVLHTRLQLPRIDPPRELDQHPVDRRIAAQLRHFLDPQAAHLLALALAALEPVLQDRDL